MARTATFQKAVNEALDQEMERDKTVVIMGEDVAGGTYMTWDEFHARVTEATGRDRALFPTPASALKGMVDDEAVKIMLGIVPGDDAALLADSGLGEWRPVTETLADTVRWLIAGGLLDPEWAPACT